MSESPKLPVQPGEVLAGKYKVERILGAGGMGVVVLATNTLLDQKIALKFLLPSAITGIDTVRRFLREAKAAAKIQSEHVARVHDVGTLDNGAPYMVLEYLEGQDLGDLIHAQRVLPVEEAVGYVLQACEALAEAHALGIVHRDIKPSNIFLAKRTTGVPTVKLLDFGISKITPQGEDAHRDAALTRTNSIMGSPLYMSPEQMTNSKSVDARADIWSLGATLFELVGGRPPFLADSMPELFASILQKQPEPIRMIRPELPEAFEIALMRALEKDRDRRYSNVAEFARALAPFGPKYAQLSLERITRVLGFGPIGETPPPASQPLPAPSTELAPAMSTASGATWGDDRPAGVPGKTSARSVALAAGLVTVLAVAGAGAWSAMRSPPTSTDDSAGNSAVATFGLPPGPTAPLTDSAAAISEPTASVAAVPSAAVPSAVASLATSKPAPARSVSAPPTIAKTVGTGAETTAAVGTTAPPPTATAPPSAGLIPKMGVK